MQKDVVLIDNLFEKIKIRKIILIYICSIILTFAIVAIPFINNICLKDKAFREIILNLLIIIWFCIILSKENVFIKSKIINCIKNIDYKKITHLYILNIGNLYWNRILFFYWRQILYKTSFCYVYYLWHNFSSYS